MLPHVHILMATHNGAEFLDAQLRSIAAQTHQNWSLWVSDDGSTDATASLLKEFKLNPDIEQDVHLLDGPRQGSAANFLALLCNESLPAGFIAFSDQDDVWLEHKLERALAQMVRRDVETPLIYGAQYSYVSRDLRLLGHSKASKTQVSFEDALVRNYVSGHSLVMNPAAVAVARRAGASPAVTFHDWWMLQLVLAAGGEAIIDDERVLMYRQHASNVLGAHLGVFGSLHRLKLLWDGTFQRWFWGNLRALHDAAPLLAPQRTAIVSQLCEAKGAGGSAIVRVLKRHGIERESRLATVLLYLVAKAGRL